jgi:hypothetical protein
LLAVACNAPFGGTLDLEDDDAALVDVAGP